MAQAGEMIYFSRPAFLQETHCCAVISKILLLFSVYLEKESPSPDFHAETLLLQRPYFQEPSIDKLNIMYKHALHCMHLWDNCMFHGYFFIRTLSQEDSSMTRLTAKRSDVNEALVIRKLSLVSVFGNVILSGFKFFAGIAGNSHAMISDSIHSFSDVLTTLIAWIGVKLSKKESDSAHPYGHERLECVASLILGIVLMATGLGIGKSGLENILIQSNESAVIPGAIALCAALVSITGKEAMFWYTRYYAKLINSSAFMADAWHHRSDAFSSIGSLIGVAGAMMGFPVMDSVASVVICLFILKVSYDILKDAIVKLLDTSCGEDYEKRLREYVSAQNGVICVDMLRSRMFGNKIYVDLEIQVDGSKCLREAHEVAEQVHSNVERQFPDVKHIMVHVNPANDI